MAPKIQMVTDPKKAKALANQTRIQILQEIATTPQSISQLARKLNITPVAVLYHIRKLQAAGFIRLAKTTVVNNNLAEKFYEITTDAYLVSINNGNRTPKGPVPPKTKESMFFGVTPADIPKMFELLGLTYSSENKAAIEATLMKLIDVIVVKARDVQREILNQSDIKLSITDRQKIECIAMAVLPIVIDQMLTQKDTLKDVQTVVGLLQKRN